LPVRHLVYGLRILSNVPIPSLPVLSLNNNEKEFDVYVRLKEPSHGVPCSSKSHEIFYTSEHRNAAGDPIVRVGLLDKNHFIFFYDGNLRFTVAADGSEVLGDWPDDYSLEDAATYLVGPILGFVLRLRGVVPLHASAVVVEGRAIALLGGARAGKSTTAAAFAKLGYPVLSEDVLALFEQQDSFWVQPGYPRINLWPASVQALYGSEDALPVVTPAWGKRFFALDQRGAIFQQEPLPLAAIYLLGLRDSTSPAPVIQPLEGTIGLMNLVENTYVNYILDRSMRSHEFDVLGRLVSRVPVLSVYPSADPAHVPDLCRGIAEDVRRRCCGKQTLNTSVVHQG
jgi:hypothetical protein